MLAVVRSLMSGPKLLLIDDLSLGLSPLVTDEFLAELVKLNKEGLAIVLIEQFVNRALGVANRVYLLAKGTLAWVGTPAEAVRTGAVEDAYLFFFSSRRRHTRLQGDWSSDVCSSD